MSDDLIPLNFDQIVQAMVDQFVTWQLANGVVISDVLEGSITRGLFEAIAAPLEELMIRYALDLPARFFLDSAAGSNLDRLILSFTFGLLERIEASTASGTLWAVGENGAPINANAEAVTPAGVRVKVLAAGAIPTLGTGEVELAAVAVAAGAAGNLPEGTQLTPDPPIAGVTRFEVRQAWAGGADEQSDEEYMTSFLQWLDSLSKATRPAIVVGAQAAGYAHAYVAEPGSMMRVYVDDGGPASTTKLAAAQATIVRFWKAAGVFMRVLARVEKPITIPAEAFASPTKPKAQLETEIAAAWTALMSLKRMGQGVTRLELINAAAAIPGYNGINLDLPDQRVREVLDEWGTVFGEGELYPYEKPVLAGIAWA